MLTTVRLTVREYIESTHLAEVFPQITNGCIVVIPLLQQYLCRASIPALQWKIVVQYLNVSSLVDIVIR